MNSVKELQIKAIHGMISPDDFADFRESLYKTLIVTKFKNLVADKPENEELGLDHKECNQVENCLDILQDFDIADNCVVEKTFYLIKSLVVHFQVLGLREYNRGNQEFGQDINLIKFSQENLIEQLDIYGVERDLYNKKTFEVLFLMQKKSLEKYCKTEFTECYEFISGLCEG